MVDLQKASLVKRIGALLVDLVFFALLVYGGLNLFAALESCSDLLDGFGGHELAAGFTIREENIPAFRTRMNRFVRSSMDGELPVSSLEVDTPVLNPGAVTLAEVEHLAMLEP